MSWWKQNKWLWASWLICIMAVFAARYHPFFWDTIQLGAKHAHWYFEQGFAQLQLPQELDSGHPPTFGMYLALMWLLFGKSLVVSHFVMLPFLLAIVFFLWRIGQYFLLQKNAAWLLLLAFADPVLASQSLLISPDVALACFFLMGVYAVLIQQHWLKVPAALGLAMISMRGMMCVVVLYLWEVSTSYSHHKSIHHFTRSAVQKTSSYVPAGLFALVFLIWHQLQTGWIGYHPGSPWAPAFQKISSIPEFIKNVGLLGWRLLDFGRVFVWLALFFILLRSKSITQLLKNDKIRQSLLLFAVSILLLSPTFLLYKSLNAHRYLLPIFLSFTICFVTIIFYALSHQKSRIISLIIAFIGLSSGNFWVYPDKISQGWDSTLAHLPYYQLRANMIQAIKQAGIPFEAIGTAFPEIGAMKYRDLSGVEAGFEEKDFSKHHYILYSNIMNDFTDQEIDTLQKNWKPVKKFTKGKIKVILYQKQ